MISEDILWIIFIVLVVSLLILDLGVINRRHKDMSMRKACVLSAFWISMGLSFGILIYFAMGAGFATEYYTAYVIEETMSVDNLFVFIIIFAYFGVPKEYQHKALFYGIVGALVFRLLFIFAGIQLLEAAHFMIYIFGAVLIFTAIKTVMKKDDGNASMEKNFFVRFFKRFMKVSDEYDGEKFFTVKNGVKMATPLFLTVLVLEMTDLIFAFDSIPAALAVVHSKNIFIVYSSNVFAVLGLRSIYFALRGAVSSLAYLKYGLGAILLFVGMKMILSDKVHIEPYLSLIVIILILSITVILSITLSKRRTEKLPEGPV
ncbi:MAG: TerC/Alx family metal homeostasis membrane protein [Methanomassiliicoccaceae archaeon]|jgi:tellurite resistance protein TerC|nr:TerC/Alx family metal homeostasis membrane protein [Methanomassiliicoccaceae archaeon]